LLRASALALSAAASFARITPGVTVVASLPETEAQYAFVVARDNETLRSALNDALEELEADGMLRRLRGEWLAVPGG